MRDTYPPLSLNRIREAVQRPRPGLEAQLRMAVRPRPGGVAPPPGHPPKPGAVLILLYPLRGQLHLVLTRRTETVAHHRGQISLPGGAHDAADASLLETALRETEEELGTGPQGLEVLGALTPLYIPPSDFCIHPFVAHCPRRPQFYPDPVEVAELLEVPLALLLDPAIQCEEEWDFGELKLQVPFYLVGEHKVWGATAMVLSEFVTMIEEEIRTFCLQASSQT